MTDHNFLQVEAYKDQKSMENSLRKTKMAIEKLDKILIEIMVIVVILVWLLLMVLVNTKVIVFISSQFLHVMIMFKKLYLNPSYLYLCCTHLILMILLTSIVRPEINSNFLKNDKIVLSVRIQNFSRSRMMKRISPLESSCEI